MNEIISLQQRQELQTLLQQHQKTLTCAESCTGGLVASLITELSGSSEIFNGSIVSYSNEIKMQELQVKASHLEDFGAVSHEVVEDMLHGVLEKFNADFGIAISGIAGPNGGSIEKPVGTVVIGVKAKNGDKIVDTHYFSGDRKLVQIQAAQTSLKKILNLSKKTLTNLN
jgi:nicotinamide-nucleotide amidase